MPNPIPRHLRMMEGGCGALLIEPRMQFVIVLQVGVSIDAMRDQPILTIDGMNSRCEDGSVVSIHY